MNRFLVSLIAVLVWSSAVAAQATPNKNPYTGDTAAIAQGNALFHGVGCNGCHGGGGGGGICPPVINDIWVYGSADSVLINLIQLGSVQLRAKGYVRIGQESVIGDMPPFATIVTRDQTWKIIAYVRSIYKGDPAKKDW